MLGSSIHGGKFSGTKVEPGVTHLICTNSNYSNLVAAVQKADQLRIPIVTYDWLEESLVAKYKYKARGKFLVKNHCKMSAAEKRERKKREREALRKDGECLFSSNFLCFIVLNLLISISRSVDAFRAFSTP